ncbi:hypothetical protein BB559_002137 [Furculomyces boomerangus]|uniref:Cystinosin n=1 Tax=Furculomyces boomerangus TaxID=61424 RepID=A0A2T9YXS4_9FUNG|nr:hypothetical protein BB559_002137 [Furculomyces boomerangus]
MTANPISAEFHGLAKLVSMACGWLYFIAWSISSYPQLISNFNRKSVQGISIDFIYLSTLGFIFYSTFNIGFYYSESLKTDFKKNNQGEETLILFNDVLFAVHSVILSFVLILQSWYYKKDKTQKLSYPAILIIFCSVALAGFVFVLQPLYKFLMFSSYMKIFLTVTKYAPQAFTNFKRKSTSGWSIYNVLLDLTGGILSSTQLLIDASLSGNIFSVANNPGKLLLASISILFDLVFITQHYILYSDSAAYHPSATISDSYLDQVYSDPDTELESGIALKYVSTTSRESTSEQEIKTLV